MKYEKAWLTLGASGVVAVLVLALALIYTNPPYKVDGRKGGYWRVHLWTGNVQHTNLDKNTWSE